MYPHLFKMDQQCGAPPDAFSAGGQNWGFPTYNWDTMQQEDYRWWRNRLEYMSVYFDATRIDHVIGLFRMWSIPYGNKTGELGIFDPVIGYTKEELESNGIHLDEQRLCDPFINDAILHFYFHGEKSRIEETYLENNRFKPEFDNQAKLDAYLESANESLKAPLKQLMTNVIMIKKGSHFHFRMNMQQTPSYQSLPEDQKHLLDKLYNDYFGERQENIWTTSGKSILEMMKSATQMMLCAEDLGMVPSMVPGVLKENEILSLYIERMPHQLHQRFGDSLQAPYLSVVTPSTHDMETLASWWEHHPDEALLYFYEILKGEGDVPNRLTSKIGKEIIKRHLNVHAMWVVFLLQDILIADKSLIREDVIKDRINDPGNDDHVWDYRFHISMEQLEDHRHLAEMLRDKIFKSGRL
jgi:4-alpha-glucanotransferase